MARKHEARAPRERPEQVGGLPNRVYLRLRELIVLGRLSPGSRIVEKEIASRLGVSRTPVRTALQRLQQDGFVVAWNGGKNVRLSVAPLTEEDGRELLGLLGALEGLAGRWAAQLPQDHRKALASELAARNDSLGKLLGGEAPDPEALFNAHSAFHHVYLDVADAPRLKTMHATIAPQAERYRRVYLAGLPADFRGELEEHEAIIGTIEAGDPEAAQLAVQANWILASERLARVVVRTGARGSW